MRVLLADTTEHWPSSPIFADVDWAEHSLPLHTVVVDENRWLRGIPLIRRIAHRLSPNRFDARPAGTRALNEAVAAVAAEMRPNLFVAVKGQWIETSTLRTIRDMGAFSVNFATDDVFNPASSSTVLRAALPEYDLWICTKRAMQADLDGIQVNSCYLPFAFKPEHHFAEASYSDEEAVRFRCECSFVGAADADRADFFERLLRIVPDLDLRLYGGAWAHRRGLRNHAGGVVRGREYRLAAALSSVNLNLVRRANRDGHVMRSFELPAMGAYTIFEDTVEHRALFDGGPDVDYFRDPEQAAERIAAALAEPATCRRKASDLRRFVATPENTYGARLRWIMDVVSARLPCDLRHGEPSLDSV